MLYIYIFCDDQLSSGILDRECIGCGNGASVDGQRPAAAAAACANTQRSSNTRVGWTVSIAIGSLPPTNQRLWAVWPTFPLPHVHQRQLPPPGTNTGHRTRGKKQTFFLWTKESWLLFLLSLSLSCFSNRKEMIKIPLSGRILSRPDGKWRQDGKTMPQ